MRNPVDAIVGFFSPEKGLRRFYQRQLLKRAYEGASEKDGWRPRRAGASANTDHAMDATKLRARSRALEQNVPYIARGMRAHVASVIGTGITPKSLAKRPQVAKRLNELWQEWVPLADADGKLDLYGLQALAFHAQERDGECLIRIRPRYKGDGLPVPLQLQVLEIDWLDSLRTENRGASTVINGIQYDALGRVEGYWLFDEHPGEIATTRRGVRRESHFVPAASVIHFFTPERPGQGRGFPRLAPVIARVRDLQLYEDAELARKNLETRLSVLASGDPSVLANAPTDFGHAQAQEHAQRTGELGPLPSGGITHVPDGVNLTVVDPKPAGGYVDYVRYTLHLIAAGAGWTYEMMTGDVSQVNFSSARVRRLDYQREVEMTQWVHVVPRLCDRIWRAFVDAAFLDGEIDQVDYAVDWSTPKWSYVNPQQEVRADLDEIAGGLSSISEKLRQRGYKPEQVFEEMKQDFDKLKQLGLLDILMMLQKGRPMDSGTGSASS